MRRIDWLILGLSVLSPATLLVNFLSIQFPLVQIGASILFIGASSALAGQLFFARENSFFKAFFGFATLLVLLALAGAVFIVLGKFSEIVSFVTLIAVGVILGVALIRRVEKSGKEAVSHSAKKGFKGVDADSALLSLVFLVGVVAAFRLLWLSRTGEGGSSVWLTIPSFFTVVFLMVSLSLAVVLFFTRLSVGLKLGLICLYSFLSHSLFLLVWYPGRYGDPWMHLGWTRFIDKTGMPYAYSSILENSLWVELLRYKSHYAVVVFFERMFYVDIYWVYVVLVPVLWSIFAPLLAFKIAEALTLKKSKVFQLVAAMATGVFSSLVAWGAVSVPNSFGFIFFFLSVALLLLWMKRTGRHMWFLALLAAATSFLAHPQTGVFAFMLLLFGSVLKKTSRKVLWFVSLLLMCSLYPLPLYVYGASFAPFELFQVSNFLAFQSEISTILLIFGVVGLVLGVRGGYVGAKLTVMLFVFYVVTLFEYYFTRYGMKNVPFGAGRILAMADFLLVPFVALGLLTLVAPLKKAFSGGRRNFSLSLSSRKLSVNISPRFLGFLLVALFLSMQATSMLYRAYPQSELVKVQPSAYEIEAIKYIDSNSSSRYVVLGHPAFGSLAVGFLGMDYAYGAARGLFGPPDWSYPTVAMYLEMTKNPSVGILKQAMNFGKTKAEISYFVVSVREKYFEEIVDRTLEILPVNRVFGDGKLYVFKYPLPVFKEDGSVVKVVFDDGLGGEQYVNTTFVYMVESEINSTLTLTGYTSYNVTEFPMHWTFLELAVNNESRRFDDSSDINTFIYVKGLQPSDVLTIKWLFNRRYPNVGWKEDSFKRLDKWRRHDLYPGTIVPTISPPDGNILRMSYSFTPGNYSYYYYVTSVNVSTNDYPYLLMRWRADLPVAVAAVYFELMSGQGIVSLGSISLEWSTIVVPLTPNSIVSIVMVGLSNARNQLLAGLATLEIDYILFSAQATS